MSAAHLHLVVNHLPIFAVLFALPLLAWAWARRSRELLTGPVAMLAVAAVGALLADQSGERAEEQVEHLPSVSEAAIYTHEEMAEVAVALTVLTGVVAVGAWLLSRRSGGPLPAWAAAAPLGAASIASVALLLTGLTGGQIHHPEARDGIGAAVAQVLEGEGEGHEAMESPDEEAREHGRAERED